VTPNGQLSGVHSGAGLGGLEWQTSPKLSVSGYYGGVYFGRNLVYCLRPLQAPPARASPVSRASVLVFLVQRTPITVRFRRLRLT
jgi:hypothetical protein